MQIFLDMDGVICNWTKAYLERVRNDEFLNSLDIDWNSANTYDLDALLLEHFINNAQNHKQRKSARWKARKEFWRPIEGDITFWSELEWMPDGKILWDYLLNLRISNRITKLNILSSPSHDPLSVEGKNKWLEDNHIAQNVDRIIIDPNKSQYATDENDVLIDDTPKKIKGWIDNGGYGILHINANESIEKVKQLLTERSQ